MINIAEVTTGDYVCISEAFHDYAVVGDFFKIIDVRVPGEETSALGWKVNSKTGKLKLDEVYKLPHDKIIEANRTKLAAVLRLALVSLKKQMEAAERQYRVQCERITGLERYSSSKEEMKAVLEKLFY